MSCLFNENGIEILKFTGNHLVIWNFLGSHFYRVIVVNVPKFLTDCLKDFGSSSHLIISLSMVVWEYMEFQAQLYN